jgi:hypothetical protein
MEKVSEPDTDSCLTAKELKKAGISNRTGASGIDNFFHKVNLMRVVLFKYSCIDSKTFISGVLSISK